MKKLIRCTILLSLGLLVAFPAAAAEGIIDSPVTFIEKQFDPSGGEVRFARKFIRGERPPTPLPTPVDPGSLQGFSVNPGPVAMGEVGSTSDRAGGALISPRGGAMSTPRQRADRELRRLIRKLD